MSDLTTYSCRCPVMTGGVLHRPECPFFSGNFNPSFTVVSNVTPDADFIAHARTDVPALLARVAELEAALRVIADGETRGTSRNGWRVVGLIEDFAYAALLAAPTEGAKEP